MINILTHAANFDELRYPPKQEVNQICQGVKGLEPAKPTRQLIQTNEVTYFYVQVL